MTSVSLSLYKQYYYYPTARVPPEPLMLAAIDWHRVEPANEYYDGERDIDRDDAAVDVWHWRTFAATIHLQKCTWDVPTRSYQAIMWHETKCFVRISIRAVYGSPDTLINLVRGCLSVPHTIKPLAKTSLLFVLYCRYRLSVCDGRGAGETN